MMRNFEFLKEPNKTNIFSDILEKENNFLRLPRSPFINFSSLEGRLQKFSFAKEQIESWNYLETLERIFAEKSEVSESKYESTALKAIKVDIQQLLKESFNLSDDYRPYEVSLSTVRSVPCTKLHADFLPLRLICTYLGPGTIFLPKASTRYPCLNGGRENKRVHFQGTASLQADPFEILILKGRKFNKGELRPCAHRSPEIEGEQVRLVLKVDFK